MKKVFVFGLAVVTFLSVITGCGKKKEEKYTIVGKWAQGSFVFTFNEDKTCSYDALGTLMKCTYKTEGNKLSIMYEGDTEPFETTYKIEGKTLTIKDSFDEDVKYTRK